MLKIEYLWIVVQMPLHVCDCLAPGSFLNLILTVTAEKTAPTYSEVCRSPGRLIAGLLSYRDLSVPGSSRIAGANLFNR